MNTFSLILISVGLLVPTAVDAQAPAAETPTGPKAMTTPDKHEGVRPFVEAWKLADTDHDGFISKEEFAAMPRVKNLEEEKRQNLFARLDKDGDGKLGREELAKQGRPANGQGPPMQRLWELDVDKSGGVSFEEFKAGRVFGKLPAEKQEAIFQRLDTNHDGVISPADRPEHSFKHDENKPHLGHGDGTRPEGGRMERQIIRMLDKDADGAVSFDEFKAGPMAKELTEDQQKARFAALDKNHDQKLSAEDFPPLPPRGEGKHPDAPEAPKAPAP